MADIAMECGCAANCERLQPDGKYAPWCFRHDTGKVAPAKPDLTGRVARCTYGCGHEEPSAFRLAFFEYRGPGSREGREICVCGYHLVAHERDERRVMPQSVVEAGKCKGFVARGPAAKDSYYCGCRGFD